MNVPSNQEGIEDLDFFSAEVGETYVNTRIKEHCLKATGNRMGLEFIECVRRSSVLITKYFNKIIEMEGQGQLQE